MTEKSASPQRPKFLAKVLQASEEKNIEGRNEYHNMLLYAERAVKDSYEANMSIRGSFKTTTLNKKPEDAGKNDTLLSIFNFYAKLLQTKASSFAAGAEQGKTLNFKKLEIFCRDYNLVPKLLTRDDLKFIWTLQQNDWLAKGKGMLTLLTFEDFKEYLVRMSIILYHKPGLKKLILTMDGFMPKPEEIVEYLCCYLHLHDLEWTMVHLRTVGRRTQGDLNFRSKGEVNLRTQREVTSNAEARQLRQVDTGQARKHTAKPGVDAAPGAKQDSINSFGEKVVTVYECRSANPKRVIRNQLEGVPKPLTPGKLLLSDQLRVQLWGENNCQDEASASFVSADDFGDDSLREEGSSVLDEEGIDDAPAGVRFKMDNGRDMGNGSMGTASTSLLPVFIDNTVETLTASFHQEYNPNLIKLLSDYSYRPPKVQDSDVIDTGGPVVDLGLVGAGTMITITLTITNGAGDVKNVDVVCRDFGAADTNIVTHSRPLIAGFSRTLRVTFTPEEGRKTVLAFIDVIGVAERDGASCLIQVPVYYRVDPTTMKDTYPRCTAYSLKDLLGQFFPERSRFNTANFQKTLPEGSIEWPKTVDMRVTSRPQVTFGSGDFKNSYK